MPYNQYLVGNDENNLFIHLSIKILAGRTIQIKEIVSKNILAHLKKVITDLGIADVSISVEIQDLSVSYLKDTI